MAKVSNTNSSGMDSQAVLNNAAKPSWASILSNLSNIANISSSEYSANISDSQSMLSKISASVSGEFASAATSATAATDSSKVKLASDWSSELNILSNLATGFAPLELSCTLHSKFMT